MRNADNFFAPDPGSQPKSRNKNQKWSFCLQTGFNGASHTKELIHILGLLSRMVSPRYGFAPDAQHSDSLTGTTSASACYKCTQIM